MDQRDEVTEEGVVYPFHGVDSVTPTLLSNQNQDPMTWLLRAPAQHTLEPHQNPIICVAFLPSSDLVFSSLSSGSEDYTIKI